MRIVDDDLLRRLRETRFRCELCVRVFMTGLDELRTLPSFPGYRFGQDGSVWSEWKIASKGIGMGTWSYRSGEWRRLVPIRNEGGYLFVNLKFRSGKIKRNILLHHLILEAFVASRPSQKHEGCHNDGNKANNSADNLRWDTRKGNALDCIKHGTMVRGERKYNAKLKATDIPVILAMFAAGRTDTEISRRFGVNCKTISAVRTGRTWRWVDEDCGRGVACSL